MNREYSDGIPHRSPPIFHLGLKSYAFVKHTLLFAKAVDFNPPCLLFVAKKALLLSVVLTIGAISPGFTQTEDKPDFYFFKTALKHKAQKNYKEAIADFTTFINYYSDYEKAYYFRGYTYLYVEEYDNAIKDFEKLAELNPNSTDAFFALGKTYYEAKKYEKSVEYYTKSLQIDKLSAKCYNDRGMAYCMQDKFDQGLKDFYQAVRYDSTFAMAYCNAGAARYFNQDLANPVERDLKIARDWFDQAIERDSRLFLAYYNRAAVNYFLEDYDKSIRDLTQALNLHPENAMTYFYMGVVYAAKGNIKRAESEFNKALIFRPELPFPKEEIAHIKKTQGDYESAISYYKEARFANYDIGKSYRGLMAYRIAEVHALNNNVVAMHDYLEQASRDGVFGDRKVYQDFLRNKAFRSYRSQKRLKKFTKAITKGKKDNKFLDPSLRWFRMQS